MTASSAVSRFPVASLASLRTESERIKKPVLFSRLAPFREATGPSKRSSRSRRCTRPITPPVTWSTRVHMYTTLTTNTLLTALQLHYNCTQQLSRERVLTLSFMQPPRGVVAVAIKSRRALQCVPCAIHTPLLAHTPAPARPWLRAY